MGRAKFVLHQIRDVLKKDVFALVKRKLTKYDVELCYMAHGCQSRITSERFLNYFAKRGDFRLMQWYLTIEKNPEWKKHHIESAICGKNMEMIRYMFEKKGLYCNGACFKAGEQGNIELLDYLHDGGARCQSCCMWGAATKGHYHVVKHLHDRGTKITYQVVRDAVAYGFLDIVKFCFANANCRELESKGHFLMHTFDPDVKEWINQNY